VIKTEAFFQFHGLLEATSTSGCIDVQIKGLNPFDSNVISQDYGSFRSPWAYTQWCSLLGVYAMTQKTAGAWSSSSRNSSWLSARQRLYPHALFSPPTHLQGFLGRSLRTRTQSNGRTEL